MSWWYVHSLLSSRNHSGLGGPWHVTLFGRWIYFADISIEGDSYAKLRFYTGNFKSNSCQCNCPDTKMAQVNWAQPLPLSHKCYERPLWEGSGQLFPTVTEIRLRGSSLNRKKKQGFTLLMTMFSLIDKHNENPLQMR